MPVVSSVVGDTAAGQAGVREGGCKLPMVAFPPSFSALAMKRAAAEAYARPGTKLLGHSHASEK